MKSTKCPAEQLVEVRVHMHVALFCEPLMPQTFSALLQAKAPDCRVGRALADNFYGKAEISY